MSTVLSIRNLSVEFTTRNGPVRALDQVSLEIGAGRMLGLIGESGSGKTVTAHTIMGILPKSARVTGGEALFQGENVLSMPAPQRDRWRGAEASIIFQNPRAALNPVRRVGDQIADVIARHDPGSATEIHARVLDALRQARIPDPERRMNAYPHELSGGLCQRVGIAAALACSPRLLIADEPTTGLDVTTQAAVLRLIREIAAARGMAVLLITHDIALASQYCDELAVMQAGRVVETGPTEALISHAREPYTRHLLRAVPSLIQRFGDAGAVGQPQTELLTAHNLSKTFPLSRRSFWQRRAQLQAVDAVDVAIHAGEAVGLVGESGGGKSTLARMIARLTDPTGGEIRLKGEVLTNQRSATFASHPSRRQIQMVFQDPSESLASNLSAFEAIADPLRCLLELDRAALIQRVNESAAAVDLPQDLLSRYPHQLSEGQKARVGIARAIAPEPRLLVLDEPTSALDVSVQATVLKLLDRLRRERGIAMLFVSHDLSVVRLMCQRVAVLYLGQIVEEGPTEALYSAPKHPYTKALLAAVPKLLHPPGAVLLNGEPQSPIQPLPNQCQLVGRCPAEQPLCRESAPALRGLAPFRKVRCHFAE